MNFGSGMKREEIERKEKLLDELIQLEMMEQDRMRIYSGKYDGDYEGQATVLNIEATSLRLERDDGRRNINLVVTEEVSQLVKKGDILILQAGKQNQKWFLKMIMMICTPNSAGQMMVSIRNPGRVSTMATVH